jgi:excisionase family DNA binding protein
MNMELLTVQETARILRVTPITVRRYIAQGRLPAVRVGGGVRISKEAVEQLPKPVEPSQSSNKNRQRRGKPITADDPLFRLIGIGSSDGSGDISANKHKYLAEAYMPKRE